MTPRRVVLTVEVETSEPIESLRRTDELWWMVPCRGGSTVVFLRPIQVSANVIREKKRKGKR